MICLSTRCTRKLACTPTIQSTSTLRPMIHVNTIRENLQEDPKRVEQWFDENRLILNQSKTKRLLFGTR